MLEQNFFVQQTVKTNLKNSVQVLKVTFVRPAIKVVTGVRLVVAEKYGQVSFVHMYFGFKVNWHQPIREHFGTFQLGLVVKKHLLKIRLFLSLNLMEST